MCPRHRTRSDDEVLDGMARAIGRRGPAVSLGDVAAAAGFTSAGLVHRFGPKRELALAFVDHLLRRLAEHCDGEPPLSLHEPQVAANHLAFVLAQLDDPRVLLLVRDALRRARTLSRAFLDAGARSRRIAPCATEQASRTAQLALLGAVLLWVLERPGPLAEVLAGALPCPADAAPARGA